MVAVANWKRLPNMRTLPFHQAIFDYRISRISLPDYYEWKIEWTFPLESYDWEGVVSLTSSGME